MKSEVEVHLKARVAQSGPLEYRFVEITSKNLSSCAQQSSSMHATPVRRLYLPDNAPSQPAQSEDFVQHADAAESLALKEVAYALAAGALAAGESVRAILSGYRAGPQYLDADPCNNVPESRCRW